MLEEVAQIPKTGDADIFIRHGSFDKPRLPTYRNFQKAVSDQNLPLGHKGEGEILNSVSEIPNAQAIDFILSSPYRRANDSAKIIQSYLKNKFNKEIAIELTDSLKEVDFGHDLLSAGEFYTILIKNLGRTEPFKQVVFDKWRLGLAKEKPGDIEKRISVLLNEIRQLHKKGFKRILLVSHASFGRALKRFLEGRAITLPRSEDKPIRKAGVFYLLDL